MLGAALAEGLRQSLGLPADSCEAFVAAWRLAMPVAGLRPAGTGLSPAFQGRHQLPRSRATQARARRVVAAQIVARDVPRPMIYKGNGATGLCTEVILPAADHALAAEIASWAPQTVPDVARILNDAHADRARRAGELEFALTAPWGANWQAAALDAPQLAMVTRPLELLLEKLMARDNTGNVCADVFEIAQATDLAGVAIEVSQQLAATRHRLHELSAVVLADGQFATTSHLPEVPANASIDVVAYQRADLADRLRLRPQPLTGEPVRLVSGASPHSLEFVRLGTLPVPGSLLTADQVMKETLGTSIDGLRAVLGTAVSWTPGADDVTEVARGELREAAITWSGLSASEIEAALEILILTPDQLREEGMPYWELERRSYRLATRPLVCLAGERLILIPRLIAVTQEIYVGYLLNGRLPWPPSPALRKATDAFNNYRNKQNRELEREVTQALSDLGMPYAANIQPNRAKQAGLTLTGEVDALAADPARSRIWVCEVKDVSVTASPRTLAARIRKFTDPDGYNHQLLRSLGEVRAAPGAAARLLGVPDPDRHWDVLPLMVTRTVEPAAFTPNPSLTYVTCEDFAAVLQADVPPSAGYAGPTDLTPDERAHESPETEQRRGYHHLHASAPGEPQGNW